MIDTHGNLRHVETLKNPKEPGVKGAVFYYRLILYNTGTIRSKMMSHQPKFDIKPTPLNKYILPMLKDHASHPGAPIRAYKQPKTDPRNPCYS